MLSNNNVAMITIDLTDESENDNETTKQFRSPPAIDQSFSCHLTKCRICFTSVFRSSVKIDVTNADAIVFQQLTGVDLKIEPNLGRFLCLKCCCELRNLNKLKRLVAANFQQHQIFNPIDTSKCKICFEKFPRNCLKIEILQWERHAIQRVVPQFTDEIAKLWGFICTKCHEELLAFIRFKKTSGKKQQNYYNYVAEICNESSMSSTGGSVLFEAFKTPLLPVQVKKSNVPMVLRPAAELKFHKSSLSSARATPIGSIKRPMHPELAEKSMKPSQVIKTRKFTATSNNSSSMNVSSAISIASTSRPQRNFSSFRPAASKRSNNSTSMRTEDFDLDYDESTPKQTSNPFKAMTPPSVVSTAVAARANVNDESQSADSMDISFLDNNSFHPRGSSSFIDDLPEDSAKNETGLNLPSHEVLLHDQSNIHKSLVHVSSGAIPPDDSMDNHSDSLFFKVPKIPNEKQPKISRPKIPDVSVMKINSNGVSQLIQVDPTERQPELSIVGTQNPDERPNATRNMTAKMPRCSVVLERIDLSKYAVLKEKQKMNLSEKRGEAVKKHNAAPLNCSHCSGWIRRRHNKVIQIFFSCKNMFVSFRSFNILERNKMSNLQENSRKLEHSHSSLGAGSQHEASVQALR